MCEWCIHIYFVVLPPKVPRPISPRIGKNRSPRPSFSNPSVPISLSWKLKVLVCVLDLRCGGLNRRLLGGDSCFPPNCISYQSLSFFLPSPLLAQFVSDWILVVNGIYSRIGTPHTQNARREWPQVFTWLISWFKWIGRQKSWPPSSPLIILLNGTPDSLRLADKRKKTPLIYGSVYLFEILLC